MSFSFRTSEWNTRDEFDCLCRKVSPLHTVLLSNILSPQSKTDKLQANVTFMHTFRNAFLMAFTETWLDKDIKESELHINIFDTPICSDCDKQKTAKQHGGSVCFYIN